ncbi:MAG TPA: HAMP domain-containing sensor histidine kinase [Anaerovoracaceae bacterium]|nr:HAMP domain-containing sensor histidine kinase [Anaerovoracaceae bacterium]
MNTKIKTLNNKAAYFTAFGFCIIFAVVVTMSIVLLSMCYDISNMPNTEEGLMPEIQAWLENIAERAGHQISLYWIYIILGGVGFLATLVYLLVSCGKRDEDGNIIISWFDKIFAEIQLVLLVLAGAGVVGLTILWYEYNISSLFVLEQIVDGENLGKPVIEAFENMYGYGTGYTDYGFSPEWVEVLFLILGAAVCFGVGIALIVSLIKKVRAGQFWRNSIVGGLILFIIRTVQESDNVFWKVMLIAVIGCLMSATIVGAVLVLIVIFVFVPRACKKYNAIKNGVSEVASGNLNYKIPTKGNGELDRLAQEINEISEASSIAVQNELKNQRLKTELISNVSHDIKTPLTSMITYVDLMRTEGLDSVHAPEYLDIIDEKTRRLQKLTEDLFEAAKASSGDLPVRMDRIEMVSMMNQSLAEFDDKFLANNLEVVFNPTMSKAYVQADGQLLWRVIENMLVNVTKYALAGSRVYIDLTEKTSNLVVLDVKNISRDQLNISAEELMERFKRGDSSRATEGSGLGLSIAKDLTKLMGGWFEIAIDGDLFKASVALGKAPEPAGGEPEGSYFEQDTANLDPAVEVANAPSDVNAEFEQEMNTPQEMGTETEMNAEQEIFSEENAPLEAEEGAVGNLPENVKG